MGGGNTQNAQNIPLKQREEQFFVLFNDYAEKNCFKEEIIQIHAKSDFRLLNFRSFGESDLSLSGSTARYQVNFRFLNGDLEKSLKF